MGYGKDMSKVYFAKSTDDLKKLRRHKIHMLQKVSGINSYFARRDLDLLAHQIMQIDAVLESREAQMSFI